MDSYVFLRPGPHEKELPGDVFWWESADGSRVLAYRIPHAYCGPGDEIAPHLEKSLALLPPDAPDLMVFYGVGNHGGGPTKAQPRQHPQPRRRARTTLRSLVHPAATSTP